MDFDKIHKEFEALSEEVGIPAAELERLCADALKCVGGLSLEEIKNRHELIDKRKKELQTKIKMGARRTNGTLQFPV